MHLRELRCDRCGEIVAQAGARSFITDQAGDPLYFTPEDPPAEMVVQFLCPNGHAVELNVPNEISAEEALATPDDAPIATDARIESGTSDSGKSLP